MLHWLTHRIPGVPPHAERPPGHHGTATHLPAAHLPATHLPAAHLPAAHHSAAHHLAAAHHSAARPPRFLPGWQRRVAALFGREL